MSKRCCAKMCFNSQTTNRNVHYFGFPKYPSFAMSWAIAAGREDLLEKKMSSIVKYFLCSEHFTSGCFADPPFNTRLKKTLRPEVSIPIPSIFESNIDKYIPKNALPNTDQSQPNDDDVSLDLDECYNCEVPSDVRFLDVEMPDIHHGGIAISDLIDDHTFVDVSVLDSLNDSYGFIIEHPIEPSPITQTVHAEKAIDTLMDSNTCRLCAAIFPTENELLKISAVAELQDKLNVLLPSMIQCDDSLPQSICHPCLDKVNECIDTIDHFRKIQLQLHLRSSAGIE